MAYSSFFEEAFANTKVSRLPPWPRNWLVNGFSTADLDFNNFRASLLDSLAFFRLILFYSIEGRQTVESHLVHMGTSPYAQNDIINFHLSLFLAVYIFVEADLFAKITKICTQRKFPAIW